jgi:hypothetical protein
MSESSGEYFRLLKQTNEKLCFFAIVEWTLVAVVLFLLQPFFPFVFTFLLVRHYCINHDHSLV